MSKIIVYNQSELVSDERALLMVGHVISGGRTSEDGRSYCGVTVFREPNGSINVSAVRNKQSDTFTVYDAP